MAWHSAHARSYDISDDSSYATSFTSDGQDQKIASFRESSGISAQSYIKRLTQFSQSISVTDIFKHPKSPPSINSSIDSFDEKLSPPPQAIDDRARRSHDIDIYLHAESQRMSRRFKILVWGEERTGDMFYKQARLLVHPLSSRERHGLQSKARKTLLQIVEKSFEEAEKEMPFDRQSPIEQALRAADSLKTLMNQQEWPAQQIAHQIREISRARARMNELLEQCDTTFDFVVRHSVILQHGVNLYTCPCMRGGNIITELEKLFAQDYVPTEHDWFHLEPRYPRPIMMEHDMERGGWVTHLMSPRFRGERRKWMHFVENTAGLVFIVDLTTYELLLHEDDSVNALTEHMHCFESVVRSSYFDSTSIALVLANVTAFKENLAVTPLDKAFSSYKGGNDPEKALQFVAARFRERDNGRDDVTIHFADLSDGYNVKSILESLQDRVLDRKLQEARTWRSSH